MYNKIKNIFFIVTFITFVLFTAKYYFSEKNIILINKSRTSYASSIEHSNIDLPLLENDTSDVIYYMNELEDFKNKRKKRIWEKLISDMNE